MQLSPGYPLPPKLPQKPQDSTSSAGIKELNIVEVIAFASQWNDALGEWLRKKTWLPNNISECLYSGDLRSQLECRWRWIWRCELFLLKEKHSFLLLARTVTKKAVEVKECELAQVVTGLADVRSNDAAINEKSSGSQYESTIWRWSSFLTGEGL